jgi:hypothetical protein
MRVTNSGFSPGVCYPPRPGLYLKPTALCVDPHPFSLCDGSIDMCVCDIIHTHTSLASSTQGYPFLQTFGFYHWSRSLPGVPAPSFLQRGGTNSPVSSEGFPSTRYVASCCWPREKRQKEDRRGKRERRRDKQANALSLSISLSPSLSFFLSLSRSWTRTH